MDSFPTDAWAFSKLIEQSDSGELCLIEQNVEKMIQTFTDQYHDNLPIVTASFSGSNTNEKSFFTNLFLAFHKLQGKGWLTKIQNNQLPAFSHGSGENATQHPISFPDDDKKGIYFCTVLLDIDHHSDGKKLLWMLYLQSETDEPFPGPLDLCLNFLSSKVIDIVKNQQVNSLHLKNTLSFKCPGKHQQHFCNNVSYLVRGTQNDKVLLHQLCKSSKIFLLNENSSSLYNSNGQVNLTMAQQQTLEKLFKHSVEQGEFQPRKLCNHDFLSVNNIHLFLSYYVSLVNDLSKNIEWDSSLHKIEHFDLSNISEKAVAPFDRAVGRLDNSLDLEYDPRALLEEFFANVAGSKEQIYIKDWVKCQLKNGSGILDDMHFDVYTQVILQECLVYLTKRQALDLYTEVMKLVETRLNEETKQTFFKVRILLSNIFSLFKSVNELGIIFKGTNFADLTRDKIMTSLHKSNLLEMMQLEYENLSGFLETQREKKQAAESYILNFFKEEVKQVLKLNPFLPPDDLKCFQENLIAEIISKYNSVYFKGAEKLLRELEEQVSTFHCEHTESLKNWQRSVNGMILKCKGGYENEMSIVLEENKSGLQATAFKSIHKQKVRQALRKLVTEMTSSLRHNEPEIHQQTLKNFIEKSWFQFERGNNDRLNDI